MVTFPPSLSSVTLSMLGVVVAKQVIIQMLILACIKGSTKNIYLHSNKDFLFRLCWSRITSPANSPTGHTTQLLDFYF